MKGKIIRPAGTADEVAMEIKSEVACAYLAFTGGAVDGNELVAEAEFKGITEAQIIENGEQGANDDQRLKDAE